MSIDAAGTLLRPARSIAAVYHEHAQRHGTPHPRERIAAILPLAMAQHRSLRRGDPTWSAYWRAVVADATGVEAPALVTALVAEFARPQAWRIADGARECLSALRARGLRVGLLSNWDVRLRDTLAALELAPAFDALAISGELGLEKPDPRIFEHLCAALGVDAAALAHVGDDAADDVAGADAIGAWGLHIERDLCGFEGLRRLLCG
ncbi:MAG: HAD-IA family hydrolase [Nannocystaceae bacterium]|nr:HAD-IA family hydrolase [Nannocystaceae bacterium]